MQYAPPSDVEALDVLDEYLAAPRGPTVLDEVRAYVKETATLHAYLADLILAACAESTVVAGVPVVSFPGGIVLAACERTYEIRAALRAKGGTWRVVNTNQGKVLGWAFASNDAEEALELIRTEP